MKFCIDNSSGSNRIRLDISDLKLADKDKLVPHLIFNGNTYNVIKQYEKDPKMFDHIFVGTNSIFKQMSNDELVEIAKFFAHANICIKETLLQIREHPKPGQSIVGFAEQLGDQYLELVKKLNLVDKYRNYTMTHVHMQDMSMAGTRPQDTKELTFTEPEMRETMVVACLCKLASPIFGEIINNLPEEITENGKKKLPRDKEMRCVSFMTAVNSTFFPDIVNKMQHYIHHIVDSLTAKKLDSAAIFAGLTPNSMTSLIMSSLLVRNFVSCELEKQESNIIRYMDTMVRTLVQTQTSSANRAQVRTRKAPGSMISGDDSNSADQMEVDSLVSIGTLDGPILVTASVDDVVEHHRQDLNILRSDYQSCMNFFMEHPIRQTPLNLFATTAVFGHEIGGGRGIEMLTCEPYTKLVALLQLISFNMGYIQLGNYLTAAKSIKVKIQLTIEDELFKRQAPTLSNYRACRASFSRSIVALGDDIWDKQMGIMLDDLASSIYMINTPDYILNIIPEGSDQPLGASFSNGDTLIPTVEVTEQLCSLIRTFNKDIDEM